VSHIPDAIVYVSEILGVEFPWPSSSSLYRSSCLPFPSSCRRQDLVILP